MGNNLLKGKRGIIFGALNDQSIAWKTAEHAAEEGAKFVLTNTPVGMRFGTINELAEKYNFKAGEFTATVDSSNAEEIVTTFDAVMKGETPDDVLTWHGTVNGEDIEGSAVWTKKGKIKKSFAFVGLQKKKK